MNDVTILELIGATLTTIAIALGAFIPIGIVCNLFMQFVVYSGKEAISYKSHGHHLLLYQ